MDDTTLTSDAAGMNRRILLEQLATIRSVMIREENVDADHSLDLDLDDVAIKDIAKANQVTNLSTEFLLTLTVLQDILLLRLHLLNEVKVGEGAGRSAESDFDVAAAAKKKQKKKNKKKRASKRKRHKHKQIKDDKDDKAATEQKKKEKKLKSWSWLFGLGGGIISLIMMIGFSFSSITTPIVTVSLFHPSDGSSEGKAPPAMPPSISRSLRGRYKGSNNAASTSPGIISPLSPVVPPTPIFSPGAAVTVRNHRRNADDRALASTTTNSPKLKPSSSPTFIKSATPSSSLNPSSSPTISEANASDISMTCVDTPGWVDKFDRGCYWYEKEFWDDPGCQGADVWVGKLGPVSENCCHCGKKSVSYCDDVSSKCQKHLGTDLGIKDGVMTSLCEDAESCSCPTANEVKIVDGISSEASGLATVMGPSNETVGLYDECKCDFWLSLCKDTRVGEACDYAAEYCCGDYMTYEDNEGSDWGVIPLQGMNCYCDFFNYAQNDFEHALKSKTLNVNEKFPNPCGFFPLLRSYLLGRSQFQFDARVFVELPSLVAIHKGTNGENWKNNTGWNNYLIDYCEWYGISCDAEGYVASINLRDNNLTDHFPTYTKENEATFLERTWVLGKFGLSNLFNLKTVDLADNKLTGIIDYRALYNLPLLTQFDVSGNQLSGELDALVSPSITHANFGNNNFTSMRIFERYKGSYQTLRFCDVSNNNIEIDAADLLKNIPPNIEEFIASSNTIKGSLPESMNHLEKLRRFDMSSNALSGTLPGFVDSILSLQELDLSNQMNGFTGSIPDNIWRLMSIKKLNLAGNKLEGTIPRSIGDMTVLEVLDLSNNFLKSSIPPELGMLEGSLKWLGLINNTLTGIIPSQLGHLQGASVLLQGNNFQKLNFSATAPLSLCTLRIGVKEFDLANDTDLCPVERNALSEFYDSAKGAEWTNDTNWVHEHATHCDWHGVTCDNKTNHVTKLELYNNGLSGRLSSSIVNLRSIERLDLSDNDIKGSIPSEIGRLSKLTHLRLSYNAFTGAAPEDLAKLTNLQLLQLQSNRIRKMPDKLKLDDAKYGYSTFVTDCGVPSAFDEALKCKNCTMCCNANDDCYPQEDTFAAEMGLKNYGIFAAVAFAVFNILCCIAGLFLYCFRIGKSTMPKESRQEHALIRVGKNSVSAYSYKPIGWLAAFMTFGIHLVRLVLHRFCKSRKSNHEYALRKIGKDSVYSYIVIDNPLGWLAAFATLFIQVFILVFFVIASEANLQDDKIDIEFTWKCPRDSHECRNTADLNNFGWAVFVVLMVAFLAKDFINGGKLIYHSSKSYDDPGRMIRYFFGGMGLFSITTFALYVSTVYNSVIATSNTALIVNSVVVLFVMDIDEVIFAALEAISDKFTEHTAEAETEEVSKLKKELDDKRKELEHNMKQELEQQRKDLDDKRKELERKMKKELERKMKEELERQRKELERKMKEELERQRAQIAFLIKEELERQRAQSVSQQGEIDDQRKDLRKLPEAVEAMQESQAGVADAATAATSNIESTDWEGEVAQIPLTCESGVEDQDIVAPEAPAATKSSKATPQ